ncbi:DUF294 nucleotidyltransferase-like domain-containing protein [Anaerolineales bacterium HSG6]|nr:DUF294 nucleotidyltransferase-like domain-containing protein [Anaerolineales bacterium HSG6]MDM8532549.1 DUF294 nucleotidyltransferase-like domain-containing protein [Anaerolineales bacterium HSG25]
MNQIDFVKTYPPFNQLPAPSLETLINEITIKQYTPAEYILRQGGSPCMNLYLIHTGTIRLVRDGQQFDFLESGELFGYPSLMFQSPPLVDAICDETAELYAISQPVFKQLLNEHKLFAEFFLNGLADRLRHTNRFEVSAFTGNLTIEIGTLIDKLPVTVKPDDMVQYAAQKMRAEKIGSVLVESNPSGILTEDDFTVRVLAKGLGPDTPVHQVMSRPVKTLPSDTPIYGAMLFMLEEEIHRVPITKNGQITGVISATDLLRHQTTNPFYLFRQLKRLEDPETLKQYTFEVAKTVDTLFHGGLDVTAIGRMVASLNDALLKRILKLTEDHLGPPPTPYTWLVFGSEGRMEQLLLTDQDNALVYQDDTPEAAAYFATFTKHVVDGLLQAGFPLCPGGYMATNWHKPLAHWKALFKKWILTPEPQALLEAAIFFDFRAVHGDLSVKSLDDIILEARSDKLFLAHLARSALQFVPPLGVLWGIRKDKKGRVNLKKGGITPIVSLARVYGMEAGVYFPSTLERLESAVSAGNLSQDGGDTLSETFRFILQLRLEEQLLAYKNKTKPGNKVVWNNLAPIDRRHLKEAFGVIQDYQGYLSGRFHTDRLG